jgi:hypothetical protein
MLALHRTPEDVATELGRVANRIPGGMSATALFELVTTNQAQAFPLPHSSIIACLYTNSEAHILAAAGRMDELLAFEPTLCRYYAERGARTITLAGRRGWQRVLASRGWVRDGDKLVKRIAFDG